MSEEESEYSEYSEESEYSEDSEDYDFDVEGADYLGFIADNIDELDGGTDKDLTEREFIRAVKRQLKTSLMEDPLDIEVERAIELLRAIRFWIMDIRTLDHSYFLMDSTNDELLLRAYRETIVYCISELRSLVLNNCSNSLDFKKLYPHFYSTDCVRTPRLGVVELMKYLIGKKAN